MTIEDKRAALLALVKKREQLFKEAHAANKEICDWWNANVPNGTKLIDSYTGLQTVETRLPATELNGDVFIKCVDTGDRMITVQTISDTSLLDPTPAELTKIIADNSHLLAPAV